MAHPSFNQTAYRILRLLVWLAERPLTFGQINECFEEDPAIGRSVSQDTLWLYLNTLKALGCKIARPTLRNGFCYSLQYHPFNYKLNKTDIDTLKLAMTAIDERLDYWDVIYMNQWMQSIFEYVANENREELSNDLLKDTRQVSIEELESVTKSFEIHAQQHQLLKINYESPAHGLEEKVFLPQKIFHYQNVLYVLGHTPNQENSSMLRLDRIKDFEVVNNPEVCHQLLQKQLEKAVYVIRILNCTTGHYETLGEEEEVITDPVYQEHLLVKLTCNNPFLLKQKLLTANHRFQVLYPTEFQKDVRKTLNEMKELYAV